MSDNLLVSFSGGETSAFMSWIIKNEFKDRNIVYVFANTGQENEKTLVFVDRVSREYGLNVVWVEAVINHEKMKGTTHKIVDFNSCCRDESLFVEMCKKYGIPNKAYPHCNRELKLQAIKSFARGYFKGEKYKTAIGIRADEYRRVSGKAEKNNIIYPLVDMFTTRGDVKDFWRGQGFGLGLKEHQGNCKWCWKKSFKKLFYIVDENPEFFDVPKKLENNFGLHGHNIDGTKRVIFRGNKSTSDVFKMSNEIKLNDRYLDIDDGCSESCELYPT